MYNILLTLHNWTRWLVLILAIAAAANAWAGYLAKREWSRNDRTLTTFFGVSLDIQLLLGLILYFISPFGFAGLSNLGGKDFRFFGLEHVIVMVLAVIAGHLASVLARRADQSRTKFFRAALWSTISLVILLIGIPWWRPLLRI